MRQARAPFTSEHLTPDAPHEGQSPVFVRKKCWPAHQRCKAHKVVQLRNMKGWDMIRLVALNRV